MMQYIESQELREWVKKSLRKTIVLKAHELAMQTGCEVLLKIRDQSDDDGNFYYATESLQEEYNAKGLCKQSNETCVSGETGLPVYPKVSIATQKDSDPPVTKSTKPVENTTSTENNSQQEEETDSILPLQLTVTDENDIEEIKELEPKIKMEVVEDSETDNSMEIPSLLLGDDNNDLAAAYGMQDMDNPSSSPLQVFLPAIAPKLYQCAICQKAFRSVQVLQKHTQAFHVRSNPTGALSRMKGSKVSTVRPQGRPIAPKRHCCAVCSRSFPNVTLLNDHMSRSHMMASTNFQHTSMDDQQQPIGDNDINTSTDPSMPKISQVMSLQGSLMQISESTPTSSLPTFTIGSSTSSPVFVASPTSGPSTSSGFSPRTIPRSTHVRSVAYKSTSSPARRGNGWKSIPYEEIKVKNGTGYIIGDYVYSRDMHTQKGVMYLRCQTPKRMKCKGRAVIANEKVKITRWHNHSPPDLQQIRQQEEFLHLQPPGPPNVPPIDDLPSIDHHYVVETVQDKLDNVILDKDTAYVTPMPPADDQDSETVDKQDNEVILDGDTVYVTPMPPADDDQDPEYIDIDLENDKVDEKTDKVDAPKPPDTADKSAYMA